MFNDLKLSIAACNFEINYIVVICFSFLWEVISGFS